MLRLKLACCEFSWIVVFAVRKIWPGRRDQHGVGIRYLRAGTMAGRTERMAAQVRRHTHRVQRVLNVAYLRIHVVSRSRAKRIGPTEMVEHVEIMRTETRRCLRSLKSRSTTRTSGCGSILLILAEPGRQTAVTQMPHDVSLRISASPNAPVGPVRMAFFKRSILLEQIYFLVLFVLIVF